MWGADTTYIETYTFQFAADYNFDTILASSDTLTEPSIYISYDTAGKYYWRVKGVNSVQAGKWTNIRIITFGADLDSPTITNVTIKDANGSINIDNSDKGVKLSATITDSGSLQTVAFYVGLNDTTYSTDNYSYASPAAGNFTHTFYFTSSLGTGDTIYYKVYAMDNQFNTGRYSLQT